MINPELKNYIETQIFPSYEKNDAGHDLTHIQYVIERSLLFSKEAMEVEDINLDMVYTIAAYHDIGHFLDAKHHEKVSAEMFLKDETMKKFFTEEQRKVMAEAIFDHRASKESHPRNIYGKIVSSADRNTDIHTALKRTYAYYLKHLGKGSLGNIIEEARKHLIQKFGENGYANFKMYFQDDAYQAFLDDIKRMTSDEKLFAKAFLEENGIYPKLRESFQKQKKEHPTFSLDEILYAVYKGEEETYQEPYDVFRNRILDANDIDELAYYTKQVNPALKDYIETHVFPEYSKNDGGHNLAHILEVIRRSFALNDTFHLGLSDNLIYTIAACHDWGKYEDHERHHLIAAQHFMDDEGLKKFFTEEEQTLIFEAIQDHRSSKKEEPRSVYGKLISSADRNTRIEIVFIRSFFVAHERLADMPIEAYLDYTIHRLAKKYDEKNPENMFFEDQTYQVFLKDMRSLLKQEEEFKKRYCEVNHITSRKHKVFEEPGEVSYIRVLKK